jgi:hypothetical protein
MCFQSKNYFHEPRHLPEFWKAGQTFQPLPLLTGTAVCKFISPGLAKRAEASFKNNWMMS